MSLPGVRAGFLPLNEAGNFPEFATGRPFRRQPATWQRLQEVLVAAAAADPQPLKTPAGRGRRRLSFKNPSAQPKAKGDVSLGDGPKSDGVLPVRSLIGESHFILPEVGHCQDG